MLGVPSAQLDSLRGSTRLRLATPLQQRGLGRVVLQGDAVPGDLRGSRTGSRRRPASLRAAGCRWSAWELSWARFAWKRPVQQVVAGRDLHRGLPARRTCGRRRGSRRTGSSRSSGRPSSCRSCPSCRSGSRPRPGTSSTIVRSGVAASAAATGAKSAVEGHSAILRRRAALAPAASSRWASSPHRSPVDAPCLTARAPPFPCRAPSAGKPYALLRGYGKCPMSGYTIAAWHVTAGE